MNLLLPEQVDQRGRSIPSIYRALAGRDAQEVATRLSEIVSTAENDQQRLHAEWIESLAMYLGDQHGYFHSEANRWYNNPPKPKKVTRLTYNHIQPGVERRASILVQERPIFGVSSSTSEIADAASAFSANKIAEWVWRYNDLDELYYEWVLGASIVGTWACHTGWDTSAGNMVATGAVPVGLNGDGSLRMEPEFNPEGQLFHELLSPFEFTIDPAATSDRDAQWCNLRREVALSAVLEHYPEAEDINPETTGGDANQGLSYVRRLQGISPRDGLSSTVSPDRETVVVNTMYVRASAKYPRGQTIIYTRGMVLEVKDNPVYPTENEPQEMAPPPYVWCPVYFMRDKVRQRSFFGMGSVPQVIPAQKAMNGIASKATMHVAEVATPRLAYPKGLGVRFSDQPGQEVPYPTQMPPGSIHYVTPPSLSPEYLHLWNQNKAEIAELLGINEATAGTLPSADTSGIAIQRLQARDFGMLAPVKRRHDNVMGRLVQFNLRLTRRHSTTERLVSVVGENGSIEVDYFRGSELAGSLDLIVHQDDGIPNDPQQRFLILKGLTEAGYVNPANDKHRQIAFERVMKSRDLQGLMERMTADRGKAERQLLQMIRGELVGVHDADDDLVHLDVIETWLKSRQAEEIGMRNPRVIQIVEFKRSLHKQQFAMKVAAQRADQTPPDMGGGAPAAQGASTGFAVQREGTAA